MSNKKKYVDPIKAIEKIANTEPASSTDCTGLIPTAPKSDTEIENYEDLLPFLPPDIDENKI